MEVTGSISRLHYCGEEEQFSAVVEPGEKRPIGYIPDAGIEIECSADHIVGCISIADPSRVWVERTEAGVGGQEDRYIRLDPKQPVLMLCGDVVYLGKGLRTIEVSFEGSSSLDPESITGTQTSLI